MKSAWRTCGGVEKRDVLGTGGPQTATRLQHVSLLSRRLMRPRTANPCDGDGVANPVAGATYASCIDGDVTGQMCTPLCDDGYSTGSDATGFQLVCDENGNFNGQDAAEFRTFDFNLDRFLERPCIRPSVGVLKIPNGRLE